MVRSQGPACESGQSHNTDVQAAQSKIFKDIRDLSIALQWLFLKIRIEVHSVVCVCHLLVTDNYCLSIAWKEAAKLPQRF